MYYFFCFGGFVALALWLPHYYMNVYQVNLQLAGMLTACYALPGSIFRALGGWLSDKFGARLVMYWLLITSAVCTFVLSYPPTAYVVQGIHGPIHFAFSLTLLPFVMITVILGFFMSIGKAAVYKHIAHYYPKNIGVVGGVVGLIGGLGGFILPIAFSVLDDLVGIWSSCFMLLFIFVFVLLVWMPISIYRLTIRKRGWSFSDCVNVINYLFAISSILCAFAKNVNSSVGQYIYILQAVIPVIVDFMLKN